MNLLFILLITVTLSMGSSLKFNFMLNGLLNLDFYFTYMNVSFLLVVTSISLLVMMFSNFYMKNFMKDSVFYITTSAFVLSMLILIVSNSMIMVFLGWEGLGVSSFILIISYFNKTGANGGILTMLNNRVGDIMFLFVMSYYLIVTKEMNSFIIASLLLLSITKSAQWPFINWLPMAMAAPTPISALVHSSTLVTAGIWLCLKFDLNLYLGMNIFMFFLGGSTLILASIMALLESDFKKIIALSTLSQLGLMFLSFSLGGKVLAYFHIMMHAFTKASLFIIAGMFISSSFSNQMSAVMCNSTSVLQLFSMLLCLFSLTSILFMSGFYSKEMILCNWMKGTTGFLGAIFILILASVTGAYCIKLGSVIFLNNNMIVLVFKESLLEISIFMMMILVTISGWMAVQVFIGLSLAPVLFSSFPEFIIILPLFSILVSKLLFTKSMFIIMHKTLMKVAYFIHSMMMSNLKLMNLLESTFLKSVNNFINLLTSINMLIVYIMLFIVLLVSV